MLHISLTKFLLLQLLPYCSMLQILSLLSSRYTHTKFYFQSVAAIMYVCYPYCALSCHANYVKSIFFLIVILHWVPLLRHTFVWALQYKFVPAVCSLCNADYMGFSWILTGISYLCMKPCPSNHSVTSLWLCILWHCVPCLRMPQLFAVWPRWPGLCPASQQPSSTSCQPSRGWRGGDPTVWSQACHHAFCTSHALHAGSGGHYQLSHFLHHQG